MEFSEALSPTLLILVIIKHSQLNLYLKIHFKRQKKPKSFMKTFLIFDQCYACILQIFFYHTIRMF